MLTHANQLAESGQYAALLEYLAAREETELAESPTLALLCGIAHGRLGAHTTAKHWVGIALDRARQRSDSAIESRASASVAG